MNMFLPANSDSQFWVQNEQKLITDKQAKRHEQAFQLCSDHGT